MNRLHEYLPGDCRERIQDLLRERGMTQAELAEKIGISGGALNRYISGETDKIAAENIVKIARVFGVPTDFLLCETNIPYRTNYDIEELGLTAKAAARLYTGEVDPKVVSQLLEEKKARVRLLSSADKWYGVTYKEDKPVVEDAISSFKQSGVYPEKLWEK